MDTNLEHALTKLARGSIMRIEGRQGRAVTVFRGLVWITQDGDARDVIVADGQSFTLDRPGLAIVQALRDSDLLMIEKGGAARDVKPPQPARAYAVHAKARALRAQALGDIARRLASWPRRWSTPQAA